MAKVKQWTADRVYSLLAQRFPAPAHVLLAQVRNGTGFARAERTADAIAVSVYPSRGLWLAGIEIKVSKQDWRKELAHPDKAHALEQYCKYWYVAAPKGVVPVDELPESWGLLECAGNSISATVIAPAQNQTPPDMLLVASILRSASKEMIARADHKRLLDETRAETSKEREDASRLSAVEYELDTLKDGVARFEAASGINMQQYWKFGQIGAAVKSVLASTSLEAEGNRRTLVRVAKNILANLDYDSN